jgi:MFS family permease
MMDSSTANPASKQREIDMESQGNKEEGRFSELSTSRHRDDDLESQVTKEEDSSPHLPSDQGEKDLESQRTKEDPSSDFPTPNNGPNDLETQKTIEQDPSSPLPPATLIQSAIERPQTLLHEIAFLAVLCSSQLMTQAGFGQAVAPLHIIGNSFGTQDPGQLSWFPAAYSLTVGTFILPAGRLGDLYGHKKLVILGFCWYALWSLLAGFSVYSNNIFFACCRAFQGIGPALLLPNSIAILGRAYKPGLRKSIAFSLFGATAPGGFVIGATFSSLLAEKLWWPWAYWILAIALLLLALSGSLLIPYTPPPARPSTFRILERIDALGALTGVAGLVLINFAWNQAPIAGWQDPYIYILLIVGFLFIAAFAFVERRVAEYPLIPFKAMTKDVGFVLACIGFGWASFSVWVFYFWQFLEELRDVSPLLASAQFSPIGLSGLCAALITGFIIHRVHGSIIMLIALLSFFTGLILLVTAPVSQSYWLQTFFSIIIMPWGMDMSFPAGTLLLSNAMPKEHQGVAASLVNTVVNYSISIALGVAGTIEGHINGGGKTEAEVLRGYRGAWYLGLGLSGAGSCIAGVFVLRNVILVEARRKGKERREEREKA